jgi:hypothetical protein
MDKLLRQSSPEFHHSPAPFAALKASDRSKEDDSDLELEDKQLDSKWIEDFEIQDKNYESFYTEDINHINFHCIYVNQNNDIEKIKEEKLLMKTPNYISRDEMIGILKKNSIINNKRYTVLSIVKYNINLEPSDINFFLKPSKHLDSTFLTSVTNIDAIPLEKSISMFQDLNDIFIIFSETIGKSTKIDTKSINNTRRVYINKRNGRKKTLRNMA